MTQGTASISINQLKRRWYWHCFSTTSNLHVKLPSNDKPLLTCLMTPRDLQSIIPITHNSARTCPHVFGLGVLCTTQTQPKNKSSAVVLLVPVTSVLTLVDPLTLIPLVCLGHGHSGDRTTRSHWQNRNTDTLGWVSFQCSSLAVNS